jgi:hypothetical protein
MTKHINCNNLDELPKGIGSEIIICPHDYPLMGELYRRGFTLKSSAGPIGVMRRDFGDGVFG